MANRPLAQRTETDVVLPDDHKAEMWETGASLLRGGLDLKQKYDQAQMNNFAAQSQIEIQKVTQEWRVKNEGNPMDDKAIGELNQSYDKILGQYDDKIGFLSRADWGAVKNKIKTGYQEQNQKWGFTQSVKNAETSINSSIKTNLVMASQYGQSGDIEQARKHYADAVVGLDVFANGVLGSESKKKLTEDFKSDYMKSFIMGRAGADPDSALEMLGKEEIIKDINNPKDVELLKSFAKKQKSAMAIQQKQIRNQAINEEYLNIIDGKSSFESIDARVEAGQYNAEDAIKLKKMLVKTPAMKDDKLTIARYLDTLANLPIDSEEEAQAIIENIMTDDKIKDDTKAILIYGKKLGSGTKDDPHFDLSDMSKGNNLVDNGKNIFLPWTWFKNINRTDAVEAFIRFKQSIQGDETPALLRKKASRAVSDVAIERNPDLSNLGSDWEAMVDGSGEFMARINEDGIIEKKMFPAEDSSQDNSNDEDMDNGD